VPAVLPAWLAGQWPGYPAGALVWAACPTANGELFFFFFFFNGGAGTREGKRKMGGGGGVAAVLRLVKECGVLGPYDDDLVAKLLV
jgi:hypothetical protein